MEQKIREAFTPEQIEAAAGLTNAEGLRSFIGYMRRQGTGKRTAGRKNGGG
ncbi:MAG: hypothetical protein ACLRMZ_23580 [Blautia marasmi]